MESSRIYVKNLPPSITESDFRKHFSAEGRLVTDVKLIPNRRIGFVGYASHEDAARAVKYFNKSFIRMSRINVDFAKPIADINPKADGKHAPTSHTGPQTSALPRVGATDDDPAAKKRKRDPLDESDPKLSEYLEVFGGHSSKKLKEGEIDDGHPQVPVIAVPQELEGESDDEYEDIPSRQQVSQGQQSQNVVDQEKAVATGVAPNHANPPVPEPLEQVVREAPQVPEGATDDDWLRSRTNRLLDLIDPEDIVSPAQAPSQPLTSNPPVAAQTSEESPDGTANAPEVDSPKTPEGALSLVEKTRRLFLRNLSYATTEDDIRRYFSTFGNLEEVNLPLDGSGKNKGFAMIRYEQAASAIAAFQADRSTFLGRIIHILPGSAKRENTLDEFAISQLPLKKQQLLRKKAEAASSTFNWNSLFMSQDAVNTAMAERLGVSKHELLDPTDASAAVKQAVAETTVIQEAKAYFAANGVNIEAFKSQQRGDTSILVKNIRDTTIEELRKLFEEHGPVLRVLMPPSGTIAIVQFAQPAHCRAAFMKKAYSRFKDSVLFLEKGPKDLFTQSVAPQDDQPPAAGIQKLSVTDLLERDDDQEPLETSSLFVRNLNFSTTSERLSEVFKPLDGFVSAKVKTKTDPKKPGQVLSMGFGFVAFRTKEQAQAALKVMDGYGLDGHKLSVRASHRGNDAAEERRREDLAKKAAGQKTKIVIKNLPFEASKKEVRTLFSTYGKLVALRIPKKFNQSSRGFAFAEFSTAKEALNAINSLKDTHLLGRRLVIDFAEADEVDPEEQIKAMEKKMKSQVNKVALQQLTGGGRTKVNIGGDDEDDV
ncbi:multiple RNA-binding domain containing protein [Naviculisporaceae sp. PSN 640]